MRRLVPVFFPLVTWATNIGRLAGVVFGVELPGSVCGFVTDQAINVFLLEQVE